MNCIDFDALKAKMISEHLKARCITDKAILDAFNQVRREVFIPEELRALSYEDRPLSIGCGQTVSQPYIVALMLQSLGLRQKDRVLEIGTGSGYQTALLSCLADEVYSIERHNALADEAKKALAKLNCRAQVTVGDGTLGWSEFSPYDAIILSAAAPKIPQALIDQLKIGGRLIMPVGDKFSQTLILAQKLSKNQVKEKSICTCIFVPLIGEQGVKE